MGGWFKSSHVRFWSPLIFLTKGTCDDNKRSDCIVWNNAGTAGNWWIVLLFNKYLKMKNFFLLIFLLAVWRVWTHRAKMNINHNNRLNHIEEWSQCTWDAVKAPYLGSIPVAPCGWCSATEQLARNFRYGQGYFFFFRSIFLRFTHTHTTFWVVASLSAAHNLLPEAKAIDPFFLFLLSFFSHSHYEDILNITSEEEEEEEERARHSKLFPVATTTKHVFSFLLNIQLVYFIILSRREMPNLQAFF